jgi:hypothetical protein
LGDLNDVAQPISSAVIELPDVTPAALYFDRVPGLEIDPRRDDLVTMKVLVVTIAAHAGFCGRQSCDAHADQRDGEYRFFQFGSPQISHAQYGSSVRESEADVSGTHAQLQETPLG